jgi:hypothetical protein
MLIDKYGLSHALFGVEAVDPAILVMKENRRVECDELGCANENDGSAYTGEVLSENNPILPNPFGIDDESSLSLDDTAEGTHDIPLQNVCEAEALIPSEAVPGDTAPAAPAEIQFN